MNTTITPELKTQIATVYAARRDRLVHPEGTFDDAGRWYPSDRENTAGLGGIRSPSRAWPYSYMIACRTRKHVAELAATKPAYFAELVTQAEAALARVEQPA
jgi:hypothetical protein